MIKIWPGTTQQVTAQAAVAYHQDDSESLVPLTRLQRFDAMSNVTDARMVEYGHPADTFAEITRMKQYVAHCPHGAVRHALEMILVKVNRLCNDPAHEDSAGDIAGYARTIAMILDKEEAYAKVD